MMGSKRKLSDIQVFCDFCCFSGHFVSKCPDLVCRHCHERGHGAYSRRCPLAPPQHYLHNREESEDSAAVSTEACALLCEGGTPPSKKAHNGVVPKLSAGSAPVAEASAEYPDSAGQPAATPMLQSDIVLTCSESQDLNGASPCSLPTVEAQSILDNSETIFHVSGSLEEGLLSSSASNLPAKISREASPSGGLNLNTVNTGIQAAPDSALLKHIPTDGALLRSGQCSYVPSAVLGFRPQKPLHSPSPALLQPGSDHVGPANGSCPPGPVFRIGMSETARLSPRVIWDPNVPKRPKLNGVLRPSRLGVVKRDAPVPDHNQCQPVESRNQQKEHQVISLSKPVKEKNSPEAILLEPVTPHQTILPVRASTASVPTDRLAGSVPVPVTKGGNPGTARRPDATRLPPRGLEETPVTLSPLSVEPRPGTATESKDKSSNVPVSPGPVSYFSMLEGFDKEQTVTFVPVELVPLLAPGVGELVVSAADGHLPDEPVECLVWQLSAPNSTIGQQLHIPLQTSILHRKILRLQVENKTSYDLHVPSSVTLLIQLIDASKEERRFYIRTLQPNITVSQSFPQTVLCELENVEIADTEGYFAICLRGCYESVSPLLELRPIFNGNQVYVTLGCKANLQKVASGTAVSSCILVRCPRLYTVYCQQNRFVLLSARNLVTLLPGQTEKNVILELCGIQGQLDAYPVISIVDQGNRFPGLVFQQPVLWCLDKSTVGFKVSVINNNRTVRRLMPRAMVKAVCWMYDVSKIAPKRRQDCPQNAQQALVKPEVDNHCASVKEEKKFLPANKEEYVEDSDGDEDVNQHTGNDYTPSRNEEVSISLDNFATSLADEVTSANKGSKEAGMEKAVAGQSVKIRPSKVNDPEHPDEIFKFDPIELNLHPVDHVFVPPSSTIKVLFRFNVMHEKYFKDMPYTVRVRTQQKFSSILLAEPQICSKTKKFIAVELKNLDAKVHISFRRESSLAVLVEPGEVSEPQHQRIVLEHLQGVTAQAVQNGSSLGSAASGLFEFALIDKTLDLAAVEIPEQTIKRKFNIPKQICPVVNHQFLASVRNACNRKVSPSEVVIVIGKGGKICKEILKELSSTMTNISEISSQPADSGVTNSENEATEESNREERNANTGTVSSYDPSLGLVEPVQTTTIEEINDQEKREAGDSKHLAPRGLLHPNSISQEKLCTITTLKSKSASLPINNDHETESDITVIPQERLVYTVVGQSANNGFSAENGSPVLPDQVFRLDPIELQLSPDDSVGVPPSGCRKVLFKFETMHEKYLEAMMPFTVRVGALQKFPPSLLVEPQVCSKTRNLIAVKLNNLDAKVHITVSVELSLTVLVEPGEFPMKEHQRILMEPLQGVTAQAVENSDNSLGPAASGLFEFSLKDGSPELVAIEIPEQTLGRKFHIQKQVRSMVTGQFLLSICSTSNYKVSVSKAIINISKGATILENQASVRAVSCPVLDNPGGVTNITNQNGEKLIQKENNPKSLFKENKTQEHKGATNTMPLSGNALFVGNLPMGCTVLQLGGLFPIDLVTSIDIKKSNSSQPFAKVCFKSADQRNQFLKSTYTQSFFGKRPRFSPWNDSAHNEPLSVLVSGAQSNKDLQVHSATYSQMDDTNTAANSYSESKTDVWIGSIPRVIGRDLLEIQRDLKANLERFGQVISLKIKNNKMGHTYHAVASFATTEAASSAIEKRFISFTRFTANGLEKLNLPIKARKSPEGSMGLEGLMGSMKKELVVKNIPHMSDQVMSDLYRIFRRYGAIQKVYFVNHGSSSLYGAAILTFQEESSLTAALKSPPISFYGTHELKLERRSGLPASSDVAQQAEDRGAGGASKYAENGDSGPSFSGSALSGRE